MSLTYYAVRPRDLTSHIRIEKAVSPREALRIAFGVTPAAGRIYGEFYAKSLGTTVATIRSDKKRIAALTSPDGWERIV